jgi:hypothetical protein
MRAVTKQKIISKQKINTFQCRTRWLELLNVCFLNFYYYYYLFFVCQFGIEIAIEGKRF